MLQPMFQISKPSNKKKQIPSCKLGTRFFLVPGFLALWIVYLFIRLSTLHFSDSTPRNNIRYQKELKATRGVIYDRGGNPIAVNQIGWKIFIDPLAENRKASKKRPAADPVASCKRVADLTGRSFNEVWHDLYTTNFTEYYNPNTGEIKKRYKQYVPQGETFDSTAIDLITNRTLYVNNIGLEQIEKRTYPQGRYFSHILGFVTGQRLEGKNGGIEQRYDHLLQGTDGRIIGIRSNNGPEIRERRISTLDPINGASIYLTIDHNIQYFVYNALTNAMTEWSADAARAIVQKVDTGEILAMVSLPDYDPANWKDASGISRKNRTITDQYDPGSTMKAVTVSAALNEGIITPDSTYEIDKSRKWYYGGHSLGDHIDGIIDVRTIIKKSSNIGSAKIALEMGNKTFYNYLMRFGFREKTGIDLPGEAYGMLAHYEKWEPIKPTRVAIGQGISVTPIQMINAYSTIANGGKRMRPYVMRKVISENGEILQENHPKVLSTPISPEVAKQMREMLALVVLEGTGRRAKIPGYTIAGKTGTAEIVRPDGGYYKHNHWTSFIGFIPVDKPVFCVLVLLDNPQKAGQSHDAGISAVPVFREIAAATAQYLEIPVEPSTEK